MIYYALLCLILVAITDRLRLSRIENTVLESRFRLYAIRDLLREEALAEEVDPQDWLFQYLDSSITRTIDVLKGLSLWSAIAAWLTYRKDPQLNAAVARLDSAFGRPENERLRKIYVLYTATLAVYLWRRHAVLAALLVHRPIVALWQFIQRVGRVQTEAPMTSTLLEFSPAPA